MLKIGAIRYFNVNNIALSRPMWYFRPSGQFLAAKIDQRSKIPHNSLQTNIIPYYYFLVNNISIYTVRRKCNRVNILGWHSAEPIIFRCIIPTAITIGIMHHDSDWNDTSGRHRLSRVAPLNVGGALFGAYH